MAELVSLCHFCIIFMATLNLIIIFYDLIYLFFTGIKMFECSDCKKKFSSNASLLEHMTRHTGARPLSCSVCGRKFRQVAVLKRHVTTHSNHKPFSCGICGKRFAMKVYVQSHMKTHTGTFLKIIYYCISTQVMCKAILITVSRMNFTFNKALVPAK